MPSWGYCDLYRAKRYGRWFLLKCLKQEHEADAAYQQMLRKELEVLMRLQHPGVMQAMGMETLVLPGLGAVACMVAFNFFNPEELTIPAQITHIGPWSLATYVSRLYLESPVPPTFD